MNRETERVCQLSECLLYAKKPVMFTRGVSLIRTALYERGGYFVRMLNIVDAVMRSSGIDTRRETLVNVRKIISLLLR